MHPSWGIDSYVPLNLALCDLTCPLPPLDPEPTMVHGTIHGVAMYLARGQQDLKKLTNRSVVSVCRQTRRNWVDFRVGSGGGLDSNGGAHSEL